MKDDLNPLLTTAEAAGYIHMPVSWLTYQRRREPNAAPPFIRVGRRIYYPRRELDRWISCSHFASECWGP